MKSKGPLSKHTIRKPNKPFISKMDQDSVKNLVAALQEPEHTVIEEPDDGNPDFLVIEVKLPLVVRLPRSHQIENPYQCDFGYRKAKDFAKSARSFRTQFKSRS